VDGVEPNSRRVGGGEEEAAGPGLPRHIAGRILKLIELVSSEGEGSLVRPKVYLEERLSSLVMAWKASRGKNSWK